MVKICGSGGCLVVNQSCAGHFWYLGLDALAHRMFAAGSSRLIATKVVLDSLVLGPLYVVGVGVGVHVCVSAYVCVFVDMCMRMWLCASAFMHACMEAYPVSWLRAFSRTAAQLIRLNMRLCKENRLNMRLCEESTEPVQERPPAAKASRDGLSHLVAMCFNT